MCFSYDAWCLQVVTFLQIVICLAYGTNVSLVDQAPRGPSFLFHPESILVISEDSRSSTEGEVFSIMLECIADANPMPTYRILQTSDNGTRVITPATDARYTITGGRWVLIHSRF